MVTIWSEWVLVRAMELWMSRVMAVWVSRFRAVVSVVGEMSWMFRAEWRADSTSRATISRLLSDSFLTIWEMSRISPIICSWRAFCSARAPRESSLNILVMEPMRMSMMKMARTMMVRHRPLAEGGMNPSTPRRTWQPT